MTDPLDDAPQMIPFVTGAELEMRFLSPTEVLVLKGEVLHTTIAGKGSIARLRERRRLERVRR